MTHPALKAAQEMVAAIPESKWLNLQDLKKEFAVSSSGDAWGDTMGWWFDVASELAYRGDDVPAEWKFRPAMGADPREHESVGFWACEHAESDTLVTFGNLLCRLASILRAREMDY